MPNFALTDRFCSGNNHDGSLHGLNDQQLTKVRQLVQEQTKEWTALIAQNLKEEHELLKNHCAQQCESLKKLLDLAQVQQTKDVESKHAR